MTDTNIVTLSTSSYNQIKSENFKLKLFVEILLLEARLSYDHQELIFYNDKVVNAFKFCFAERYEKKLLYLKNQYNHNGLKDDKIEDKKEES